MSGQANPITTVHLDEKAAKAIERAAAKLMARHESTGDLEFLMRAPQCRSCLPFALRRALDRFRNAETSPAILIRGLSIDDARIGPTPSHWSDVPPPPSHSSIRREEFIFAMVAQAVGEPFGYATLQDGRLFHHLLPIAGHEAEQNGHSSDTELVWHTEDAFTSARCDYLALFGLRNPSKVGTLFAPIDALRSLTAEELQVLSEPRFLVRPDDEHLKHVQASLPPNVISIHGRKKRDELVPVLWGGPSLPYMTIDRAFMQAPADDVQAKAVFERAVKCLDDAIQSVPVGPGDILIVDNHRAVHGRAPFHARYDGGDRWILKLSLTRDLMKSRAFRESATSRKVW
jgi:L-asparagine oxygenase